MQLAIVTNGLKVTREFIKAMECIPIKDKYLTISNDQWHPPVTDLNLKKLKKVGFAIGQRNDTIINMGKAINIANTYYYPSEHIWVRHEVIDCLYLSSNGKYFYNGCSSYGIIDKIGHTLQQVKDEYDETINSRNQP